MQIFSISVGNWELHYIPDFKQFPLILLAIDLLDLIVKGKVEIHTVSGAISELHQCGRDFG